MSMAREMGFTLIETMLFLAITGLMVAGMLVGSGVAINSQRYHDAVTSLQSELQDQFSQVQNTANSNDQNATCNSSSITFNSGGTPAGASPDCYILGRYINATSNQSVQESTVIGHVDPDKEPTGAVGDVVALHAYTLQTTAPLNLDTSTYSLDWGATFTSFANTKKQNAFSVLIVRSPTSDTIRTFVSPSASQTPQQLITAAYNATLSAGGAADSPINQSLNLCIDPSGTGAASGEQDIQIAANASSADSVEVLGDADAGNPCN